MISIFKVSKSGLKSIFVIDFTDEPIFYFRVNGEWVRDLDRVDIDTMKKIYGEAVDIDILEDLEIGETINMFDDVYIKCEAKFANLNVFKENLLHIGEVITSFFKLIDIQENN